MRELSPPIFGVTPPDSPGVYVVRPPFIESMVKIGMSRVSLQRRIQGLSNCTSSPGEFEVLYCVCTPPDRAVELETQCHRYLSEYRYKKEYFNLNGHSAANAVYACAVGAGLNPAPPPGGLATAATRPLPAPSNPEERVGAFAMEKMLGLPHGFVVYCEKNGLRSELPPYTRKVIPTLKGEQVHRHFTLKDLHTWSASKKRKIEHLAYIVRNEARTKQETAKEAAQKVAHNARISEATLFLRNHGYHVCRACKNEF